MFVKVRCAPERGGRITGLLIEKEVGEGVRFHTNEGLLEVRDIPLDIKQKLQLGNSYQLHFLQVTLREIIKKTSHSYNSYCDESLSLIEDITNGTKFELPVTPA